MPHANNQGSRIYFEVHGEGAPLVMLSGLFGNVALLHEFGYVQALKEEYKVIAIDYRGVGQSDLPHDSDQYSLRLFSEDVIAVLDELKIDKCHIYGHSLGGWALFGLLKYHPHRFQKLIISDGVPGDAEIDSLRIFLGTFAENIQSRKDLTQSQKDLLSASDVDAFLAIADWVDREQQSLIKLIDEIAPNIKQDTLLLMSDLPEDSEDARQMAHILEVAANAQLQHFPELAHFQLYIRADLTLPHIKKFLAR